MSKNAAVNSGDPVSSKIGDTVITNSKTNILPSVSINSEPKFETHVLNMCNKASQISRISPHISLN